MGRQIGIEKNFNPPYSLKREKEKRKKKVKPSHIGDGAFQTALNSV